MKTRFNEFARMVRGTINVAIGIAAVTIYNSPASDATFEKLNDLAPLETARNGGVAVGISSNGFILVSLGGEDWRQACAPGARFRGVCYGKGKFVAVGQAGALAISADGVDWREMPAPTVCSLYSIAYGNKRFVAVGNEGAILRSSDGIRWKSSNVTDLRLRGIAFGNGTFVAVGYEGLMLSSRDGWNWTAAGPLRVSDRLESVAFGNHRFVAVGWKGTVVHGQGERWTAARLRGQPRLLRVVYRGENFHAISETGLAVSSIDGAAWDPVEVSSARIASGGE